MGSLFDGCAPVFADSASVFIRFFICPLTSFRLITKVYRIDGNIGVICKLELSGSITSSSPNLLYAISPLNWSAGGRFIDVKQILNSRIIEGYNELKSRRII